MRPASEPAATSLDARKLSLPHVQTLQRIEHLVVNSENVTSRLICANSIPGEQTRSSRNRSHDDVYRDMMVAATALVVSAATAAVAIINHEVNTSIAAFAPHSDLAAVSAQNPVAGCDTAEALIFQGMAASLLTRACLRESSNHAASCAPSQNSSAGF